MPIYILCKRGNDSQVAVKRLKAYLRSRRLQLDKEKDGLEDDVWDDTIKDIKGGLKAWRGHVDRNFPEY